VYNYQTWPARNIPCCGGQCLFGPPQDHCVFGCNLLLVLGNSALFSYFVAVRFHAAILVVGILITLFTIVSLFLATFTEPGILPRKSAPPPGADPYKNAPTQIINGVDIPLKYCETCHLYRPPRAKHCRECDNCVEEFDHVTSRAELPSRFSSCSSTRAR
jgi:hypothetical protein